MSLAFIGVAATGPRPDSATVLCIWSNYLYSADGTRRAARVGLRGCLYAGDSYMEEFWRFMKQSAGTLKPGNIRAT